MGQLVPNGFALEVEDRGLGMSQTEIDEANARLRRPPDFDPGNSARLGLLVVALLAARLGAQVTLRPSPFGGITAVVLVPPDLVVAEPVAVRERAAVVTRAAAALPAAPQDSGGRTSGREPLERLRDAAPLETSPETPPEPAPDPAPDREPEPVPGPPPDLALAPASGALPEPTEPLPELTEDGLPRRVRRSAPPDPLPSDAPLSQRPPEQTRAMMSAFQSAFARGRRDAQAAAEPEQEN